MNSTTPSNPHLRGAAEFERDIIRESTQADLQAARARGRQGGPKLPGNARKVALARKLYEERRNTPVKDICRDLNISRATLYRYLRNK